MANKPLGGEAGPLGPVTLLGCRAKEARVAKSVD